MHLNDVNAGGDAVQTFDTSGFAHVADVLPQADCERVAGQVGADTLSGGTRCLLDAPWCAALVGRLRAHRALRLLVPEGHVAIQCTYFEKSAARNWLVPVHQDLSIPVAARVADTALRGWSEKEGRLFVQAPVDVLEQLVAVRIHLDACSEHDGPLKVVPASHRRGALAPEQASLARKTHGETVCPSGQGGALVMRPLLLHASSKATGLSRRRVLHFVWGPRELPHGLRWHHEA